MKLSPSELGAHVRGRRTELGLTQAQVVERVKGLTGGSISEPTMRAVETGRTSASDLTLAAISQALGWPSGYLRDLRDGTEPPEPVVHVAPAGEAEPGDELGTAAIDGVLLTPEERALVAAVIRGVRSSKDI